MKRVLEVCCESRVEAMAAQAGGADRMELCRDLDTGGLTPELSCLKAIKSQTDIPVFVMIRPRPGNFVYSDTEVDAMMHSIRMVQKYGADGLVFGLLTASRQIDWDNLGRLVEACKGLPVTFHKAFDECLDPFEALKQFRLMGIERVLTSGQQKTALEGKTMLQEMVQFTAGHPRIMAGGSIRPHNLPSLLEIRGLTELHFRLQISSGNSGDALAAQQGYADALKLLGDMRKLADD